VISLTADEIIAGIRAFESYESRDAMYKVATFIVRHFWGKSGEMADGLGVLLLTWNQAFYRYGSFDFELLQRTIERNLETLSRFRSRNVLSYSCGDDPEIVRLFKKFLEALGIRKEGDAKARSPVATSKALHLLAPAFFPLWDVEIAKVYGCSYSQAPSGRYIKFIRTQKEVLRMINLEALSVFQGKTILKM
jgi:hypothetical protein